MAAGLLPAANLIVAAGENPQQVALERIDLEDEYLGGAELH
jgi:hypothetical protein